MAAPVVAAAVALSGCGSADPAGSMDTPASLAGLCRAQARPARAEDHFAGVHQRLHELAADAEARDRGVSADLLETKQAVEASLAAPPGDRAALGEQLAELIAAVRQALRTLDRPAPPCDAGDAQGG